MRQCLVFTVDDRRFALDLANVERVLPMVEVVPLPEATAGLAGVINYRGRVIPVVDLRRQCGLPSRPFAPADHLILATGGDRLAAIPADGAEGVFPLEEVAAMEAPPEGIPAVVLVAGALVPLVDTGRLLAATGPDWMKHAPAP